MTKHKTEDYFIVLALDGNGPSTVETGQIVDVVRTRKKAERLIKKLGIKKRLEILPVRV